MAKKDDALRARCRFCLEPVTARKVDDEWKLFDENGEHGCKQQPEATQASETTSSVPTAAR